MSSRRPTYSKRKTRFVRCEVCGMKTPYKYIKTHKEKLTCERCINKMEV